MSTEAPREFRGAFRTDAVARAVYSEAAGIGRVLPMAVAVPAGAEDVAVLVDWAGARGYALVPRGSGSSMAGGAIGSGVIVDLSRLRAHDDPRETSRSIRAEAGVLRGEIDRRARSRGLTFPVDPSSGEFCTIGGMVATNAAGPHSLRHGSVRPWVLALDCVFADASRVTIRRGVPPPRDNSVIRRFMQTVQPDVMSDGPPVDPAGVIKNSSGYAIGAYAQSRELIDLLVGSEGTLAMFTAVELALQPVPAARASLLVAFDDLERAVEAAIACRERGAAACELLDRTFLRLAAAAGPGAALPVSAEAEAVLLIEVEAADRVAARGEIEQLVSALRSYAPTDVIPAFGPGRETELWSFRHAASPAIARMDPRLRSMQFIEDAAVPPRALAAYVRGVRAILDANATAGVIFGHAGDAHVHVNPLIDVGDPRWRERLERILLDVTSLVARLGGTTTGEHGDGRLRTPLLDVTWPAETLQRFARVKRCFDPSNILNPGVKVPLPGQRAVDVVKYDPAADSLPAAARAALDVVERERAYARYRLDLLQEGGRGKGEGGAIS